MEIVIRGDNVDITPRLQSYVERKIGRLDRYMPNIVDVNVDLSEEKAPSIVFKVQRGIRTLFLELEPQWSNS